MNTIRHLAVHDVRRTKAGLQIVHGNDALAVNATTQRIVDGLSEFYGKRSSKAHGQFSDDRDNYPASGYFEAYQDPDTGGDFAELTAKLMTTLLAKAKSVPNAGAGHVFFALFECDGRELMLIAIVNEKLSAALTGKFDAQDVTHLDLEGFRFAGRIDLTGWRQGDDRYVGFLRGRGEVAEYFKEFLGCVSSVTDKASTVELVEALREYADKQGMNTQKRDEFMVRAKAILDRNVKDNEQLDFQAMANELVPAAPDSLTDHLGAPERGLGDGFIPNARVIGSLVKFRARTPRWSIEIDRGAIREGEITFDPENDTLTINTLPAELSAALHAELAVDG